MRTIGKAIALFLSYVIFSIGFGLCFDSVGAGLLMFGIISTWTLLVYIGLE